MKKSKKLLALLLCLAMVFGLAACGNSNKPADSQTPAPGTNTETPAHETETPGETEADPDAIEDSMTSADGKYQVAFVTDVGQLKDKSFNQGTWEGVVKFAEDNKMSEDCYGYLQSSADADYIPNLSTFADQKKDLIEAPGFLFEDAMKEVADLYPDQKFAIIDGSIVWYGSINLLSFSTSQESIMRLHSSSIARALIDKAEGEAL